MEADPLKGVLDSEGVFTAEDGTGGSFRADEREAMRAVDADVPTPSAALSPVHGAGRCLILVNPRAGAVLRSMFPERMQQRFERLRAWRRQPSSDAEHSSNGEGTDREKLVEHKTHEKEPEELPQFLSMLASAAARAGLEADVEVVPPPADLPELYHSALLAGYDTIVAVGGDGTVRTLAQGLVSSSLQLGIIPLGTANNIARTLDIPSGLEDALRSLANGQAQRIDVGRIGSEYFLEGAGVGLFADVVQRIGKEELRPYQLRRMVKIIGPLLWNLRTRTLRLTLDGVVEQEAAVMVTAANGRFLGEGVPIAPAALLSDGLFDVIIIGTMTPRDLPAFAWAMLRGKHLQLRNVRMRQARVVEIERVHRSHRPLPVHADDHIAGHTPCEFRIDPQSLRVIVPSSDDPASLRP